MQIKELKDLERELKTLEQQLADSTDELSAMQHTADKYYDIKQRYV